MVRIVFMYCVTCFVNKIVIEINALSLSLLLVLYIPNHYHHHQYYDHYHYYYYRHTITWITLSCFLSLSNLSSIMSNSHSLISLTFLLHASLASPLMERCVGVGQSPRQVEESGGLEGRKENRGLPMSVIKLRVSCHRFDASVNTHYDM